MTKDILDDNLDSPPAPWWKRLLLRVFPFLRKKVTFTTVVADRYDMPNANNDVLSSKTIQQILEEDRVTQMSIRDSAHMGVSFVTQKQRRGN